MEIKKTTDLELYDVDISGIIIVLTSNFHTTAEMKEHLGLPIYYRINKFIHFDDFDADTIYSITRNEIELRKVLDTPDELKDAANIYYKCINLNGIKSLKSPSLKYGLYHMHLFETFTERRERLKTEIEKLKEKLKNYKGDKIDINKEMIRLDDISSKLETLGKEAKELFDFDLTYLGKVAKKYDTIKDDTVKSIYVNSSEEVIFSRIKYYINFEKYFLIYNEIIKQLLSFL